MRVWIGNVNINREHEVFSVFLPAIAVVFTSAGKPTVSEVIMRKNPFISNFLISLFQ